LSELIEKSGELTWLGTDAGHLILVPAAARVHWSGIEPPPDGREIAVRFRSNTPAAPATDYDRACDIDDYVGILDVGSSWEVVLGQEPLPATWQSMSGCPPAVTRSSIRRSRATNWNCGWSVSGAVVDSHSPVPDPTRMRILLLALAAVALAVIAWRFRPPARNRAASLATQPDLRAKVLRREFLAGVPPSTGG
jgi:hypothetical protein